MRDRATSVSGCSNLSTCSEEQVSSHGLLEDGERKDPGHATKQVNSEADNIATVVLGYSWSCARAALVWLIIVLSGGLVRLVLHWRQDWLLQTTHRRCSLQAATSVLVIERYKKDISRFIHRVKTQRLPSEAAESDDGAIELEKPRLFVPDAVSGEFKAVSEIRYFRHKKLYHLWSDESETFHKLDSAFAGRSLRWLHAQKPLSRAQQEGRRAVYGENNINLPLTPILKVIFLEVLTPFYVFQLFACLLWYFDDYMYYATAIVIASVLSVATTVYQHRKNEKNLRRTIHLSDVIEVVRHGGCVQTVSTDSLVPGDVIVVPSHRCVMGCDAVLLTGNVIVNESMLTGESVPVTKVPLPGHGDELYSPLTHSRSTLFSGTQLLQTRYYRNEKVLALVTQTGFMTSKGELVRSILYPPPVDFELEQDTYKFVGLLCLVAMVGLAYSTYTKVKRHVDTEDVVLDVLDLITITVPPALPYAMAVGVIVGVERLRKAKVFCISPRSINLAGLVNYCCFDKTGTLTEDGLDMKGVVRAWGAGEPAPADGAVEDVSTLEVGEFTTGMATCHGLMLIDGELNGDPLDLKMFESTGWLLEEPEMEDAAKFDILAPTVVRPHGQQLPQHFTANEGDAGDPVPFEVGIVRQFVFASSLQRMSVLTRRLGAKDLVLYCKGSPEMVMSLSEPDTVPQGMDAVLAHHTQQGFRVLALARRTLPKLSYARAQRIGREQVEQQLTFLGLLVFENRLKPQSRDVLRDLNNAGIKTVMVTGDNMLTALSVAHDSGLLPAGTSIVSVSVAEDVGVSGVPSLVYRRLEPPPSSSALSLRGPGGDTVVTLQDTADCRLAVSGTDFVAISRYHRSVAQRLSVAGAVFARMRPHHKQLLIENIKELGYHVAMCGDGANDCGALRAAHTGVSLSEAEASVASPFTSQEPNISCVPTIIREGRGALVTSFGIFKYMAAYSLTQFMSVSILYDRDNNLTDFQFLYIDFFIITVFAGVFGMTRSFQGALSRRLPPSSLVSVPPILSLILQVFLVTMMQLWAYWDVRKQPWFVPYTPAPDGEDNFTSHSNFAVYSISSFQYIILVLVFSRGPPYRQRLHTNPFFSAAIAANVAFCLWATIAPSAWIVSWLELGVPPEITWRLKVVALAAGQLAVALFLEHVIVEGIVQQRVIPRFRALRGRQPAHVQVSAQMTAEGSAWPPLQPTDDQLSATALLKLQTSLDKPV